METEVSIAPSNLRIYFVVFDKHESEEQCNENMWESYNMCIQNEFEPEWIRESDCNNMNLQKSDVVVMEEFEGELFEKLKEFRCSIVGPRCLLTCFLSGEPIPDGSNTTFNTAMRGMVISASGFPVKAKEHIQKRIEYMGGIYIKQFRNSATHLISDSVCSIKYEKAAEMGIPIFTEKWIDAVWEANLESFVEAKSPVFDKYKCPVFMNLVVTSTNLPKRQKEEAKKLINSNGGTFMGVLDGTKVKLVLAPKNSILSDKLRYAKLNNISCVDVEWVAKSVSAGYSLPNTDYVIKSTKSTSTPEKSQVHETLNISSISMIPNDLRPINNIVNETMASTMNSPNVTEAFGDERSPARYSAILDRLDIRQARIAGSFLDGCNIYLAGFAANHRDKINRILNAGGATRLNDISDALTHVIVGDLSKASNELKIMKTRELSPYILGLEWLEESLKLKLPAPEENYIFDENQSDNKQTAEPPSPLSKKNIQMLQKAKKPPPPRFDIDKEMPSEKPDDGDEEDSIMKQYLQEGPSDNIVAECSLREFLQPSTVSDMTACSKSVTPTTTTIKSAQETAKKTAVNRSGNDSIVPFSQSTLTDNMFEGLTFLVTGFDAEENSIVFEHIKALGGTVVSTTFAGVPDFGVVPLTGATLKHTVNEIVTDLFIEDCIDMERLVGLEYYHRPLSISSSAKPLEGCVLATSTYAGRERSYLSKVAVALGALYQDTFARKTNVEKNHIGSTHLLCPSPQGSKYNAAVKWKLPAVTADWLRACVIKMRLVDETPYLVGETMAPERAQKPADSSYMGPPLTNNSPRTILSAKRQLPNVREQKTGVFVTPLRNKRLDIEGGSSDPRSPYDMPTPETPYGAVFTTDPSPGTRKEWVRWIDNFPDLKREEPPPKKRAYSTPLSELRRQFWNTVTENNGNNSNDQLTEGANLTKTPLSVSMTKHSEEINDNSDTPINRKLSFLDADSPAPQKAIDLQIEQLDQVLQQTSRSAEGRYSLSGNARVYNPEPIENIDKCMVKDSQPETVCWVDPSHYGRVSPKSAATKEIRPIQEEAAEEMPKKRKFMLSGIKDRPSYEAVITKFGGEVSTETNYDDTATHLLCIRPSRNEKSLASVAAGKWVLNVSYIRECERQGCFIDEEMYEWGNPRSKGIIPAPNGDIERSIAAAAYRWRIKLEKSPGGAFKHITAMLLVPSAKYGQFERLIQAGGGSVIKAKPPYDSSPNGKKATHCFIQLNKLDQPVEWAMLASKGILCFNPQYLSEYLTAAKPLEDRDCVMDEFKKYLTLVPK